MSPDGDQVLPGFKLQPAIQFGIWGTPDILVSHHHMKGMLPHLQKWGTSGSRAPRLLSCH